MQFGPARFPEWKMLYDLMVPLIDSGQKTFVYDELDALSRLDIRSDRGRGQFYKFRRHLLRTHQLWMENIPGCGYSVVPAQDQPKAAYRRVQSARRKVGMAKAINALVRFEEMTPEQRCLQAATAACLHELSKTFHAAGRKFGIASQQALKQVNVDLPKLLESIAQSK